MKSNKRKDINKEKYVYIVNTISLFLICLVVSFFIVLALLYFFLDDYYAVKYSYVSYTAACHKQKYVEDYSAEYKTVGQTTANIVNNTAEDIKVYIYDEKLSTKVHEECHAKQYREGRFATCDNPIKAIYYEYECYKVSIAVANAIE